MTKAELILKIAKRAEIPETDAKVFFESFLKKIASNINAGGAVKLDDLGTFIIKEGVSENLNSKKKKPRIEHKYTDLVIFHPEDKSGDVAAAVSAQDDSLIFNIPNQANFSQASVDNLFSLSFGKPVVNQSNENNLAYFPATRTEQKKLIETKAEKLFSEVQVFDKYGKESDKYFYIGSHKAETLPEVVIPKISKSVEPESFQGILQKEINAADNTPVWGEEKDNANKPDEDPNRIIDDDDDNVHTLQFPKENLSWDFGLEQEPNDEKHNIESGIRNLNEDGFFNKEPGQQANDIFGEEGNRPLHGFAKDDDFIAAPDEEHISWDFGKPSDRNEFDKIAGSVIEQLPDSPDYIAGDNKKESDFVSDVIKNIKEPDKYKQPKDYESVESLSSELKKFSVVEDQLNWDFGRKSETEPISLSVNKFVESPVEDGFIQISGKKPSVVKEPTGEALLKKGTSVKQAVDFEKKPPVGLQRALKAAILSLAGILLIAIGVYSYFKFVKHQDWFSKPSSAPVYANVEPQKPAVIERNYDVPVTYPYNKKDEPIVNSTQENKTPEKAPDNQPQQKTASQEKAQQQQNKHADELTSEQIFSNKNPGNILNKQNVASNKKQDKKQEKKPAENKTTVKPAEKKQQNSKGESGLVSQSGSQYGRQVSSWPTESKAQEEAAKLKRLGYSASVVPAYIEAKKATWYRVKINGFKSKEDAEAAYKKIR